MSLDDTEYIYEAEGITGHVRIVAGVDNKAVLESLMSTCPGRDLNPRHP